MKHKCETCDYWHGHEDGNHKSCNRTSPTFGSIEAQPRTYKEYGCGEHSAIRERATDGIRISELETERSALFTRLCPLCDHVDSHYGVYCVKHEHHVCHAGSSFVAKGTYVPSDIGVEIIEYLKNCPEPLDSENCQCILCKSSAVGGNGEDGKLIMHEDTCPWKIARKAQ